MFVTLTRNQSSTLLCASRMLQALSKTGQNFIVLLTPCSCFYSWIAAYLFWEWKGLSYILLCLLADVTHIDFFLLDLYNLNPMCRINWDSWRRIICASQKKYDLMNNRDLLALVKACWKVFDTRALLKSYLGTYFVQMYFLSMTHSSPNSTCTCLLLTLCQLLRCKSSHFYPDSKCTDNFTSSKHCPSPSFTVLSLWQTTLSLCPQSAYVLLYWPWTSCATIQ